VDMAASRRRFTVAVVIGFALVSLPFLWILWDLWTGTIDPLRSVAPANFYDLQARAMFAGHLYVPTGSVGIEAFVHNGRQFTYFGVFPSLLRMPVLAVTHQFDGRLSAPSMLLAWMVTGLFTSLLLWRVRIMIRAEAVLGRAEAVCCGILVASVTGGTVLMYLAASPKVTHEDLAWSVALTIASVFALLGAAERPSGRRVVAAGVLVLLACLNRSPTGYACVMGALLIAAWFALGRGGAEHRRWAVPMGLVGVVAVAANGLVNWAKLGMPYGLSEADQVWTHVNAHRQAYLAANGGNAFGLRYLPSTLLAYLQPGGLHVSSWFPFLSLPGGPARAVGTVVLDETYPTASLTASMPLAFLLGCLGVITAFWPRPPWRAGAIRLLLVALAAGTAGVLFFGYIADRYLADFLPFVAMAAMVGLVEVWRRMEGRAHRTRVVAVVVVAVVGVLGVWANIGAALTPTALWSSVQARNFVSVQRSLGGTAPVLLGSSLPYWMPAGTLAVVGECQGLYVSTGFSYAAVPGQQLEHETWIPVEQAHGTTQVLTVTVTRPLTAADPPVRLLTHGASALDLVPTGANHVRLQVTDPGAPTVTWPPAVTSSLPVTLHRPQRITVITDPALQSISVSGLGGGIQHYLSGTGPAVVHTATSDSGAVRVATVSRPAPSMALCRQVLRSSRTDSTNRARTRRGPTSG